jgi:hypothetical protein
VSTELEPVHRWRSEVPKPHRDSLDTRLLWLWHQRFGTVQTVYQRSPDILDRTAATLILQAIMARDIRSIQQLFRRLEGLPEYDRMTNEAEPVRI